MSNPVASAAPSGLPPRSIAKGDAWATPAIAIGATAPAFAASAHKPTISGSICQLFYGSGTINQQTHSMYLGITTTTGTIPAGTTISWTICVSGGGGTSEVPTTNYSANGIWTLTLSPATINTTGRTPHYFLTKSDTQTCYPPVQYSRVLSSNGTDNVTCYPSGTSVTSSCTWDGRFCNSSTTGLCTPPYVGGAQSGQITTNIC